MMQDVGAALRRAEATLWRDLLGLSALVLAFLALLQLGALLTAV